VKHPCYWLISVITANWAVKMPTYYGELGRNCTSGMRWVGAAIQQRRLADGPGSRALETTMSWVSSTAWEWPLPSTETRLLNEAVNFALISCEQGARSSQEAAGFQYYLRMARDDPANTRSMYPFLGHPWRAAGIA